MRAGEQYRLCQARPKAAVKRTVNPNDRLASYHFTPRPCYWRDGKCARSELVCRWAQVPRFQVCPLAPCLSEHGLSSDPFVRCRGSNCHRIIGFGHATILKLLQWVQINQSSATQPRHPAQLD